MRHRQAVFSKPGPAGRSAAAPPAAPTIQQALALHQQGQLDSAGQLYERMLAANPAHFDALHLLGVLRHQQRHSADALRLVDAALRVQPGSADALTNYGVILDALKRHQDALAAFEKVLAVRPADVTALFNKGLALKKLGRQEDALAAFEQTLALSPRHRDALSHRAGVLLALKRWQDAVAAYDAALAVNPANAGAFSNRGAALLELGSNDAALQSCDRALAIKPDYADALYNRGSALLALGRLDGARSGFEAALAREPDRIDARNGLGLALSGLGRPDAALAQFDTVLAKDAYQHGALLNRANALIALGRFDEALAACNRLLAADPEKPEAHNTNGVALSKLGRYEEALASYDRAIALGPDFTEIHSNRGTALHKLKCYDEALVSYDRALALQPDHAETYSNRGNTLAELRRFDEAFADFGRAQSLRPNLADAHFSEALCRLRIGDLKRGWQQHEWRWQIEQLRQMKRQFPQPQWTGSDDIAGKIILLHAEQGLGDTIQFCRYAPLVAARGARVVLEVPKPLATLMSTLPGGMEIVSQGEPLPDFDRHCPLLSLPLAFDTELETIPSQTPYLSAPDTKVAAWRDQIGAHHGLKVGLVWAGNPRKGLPQASWIDRQRSLAFDALAPVLQAPGCMFFSLQKGDDAQAQLQSSALGRGVVDWSDRFHDFSDTAALIENLDLVISVDTSVAHLAGALGKPLWLLNRYNTCWRWMLDRDDSPWYPAARIFRQDQTCTWDSAIARVQMALSDYGRDFAG